MKLFASLALSLALCFVSTGASAQDGITLMPERRVLPTLKVCSPYAPGAWRSMTVVPSTWTVADCQALGRSVGATEIQVGCLFMEAPAGMTERFAWGRGVNVSVRTLGAVHLPRANCEWSLG